MARQGYNYRMIGITGVEVGERSGQHFFVASELTSHSVVRRNSRWKHRDLVDPGSSTPLVKPKTARRKMGFE